MNGANISIRRPTTANAPTAPATNPTMAPHNTALSVTARPWRRTPTSPVVVIWTSATAVVPSPNTRTERLNSPSFDHSPGIEPNWAPRRCHDALAVRWNNENPANAVTPASNCWSTVNANPTMTAAGIASTPGRSLMTRASSHGVTTSLPIPHS